jgi:hypothetical protein
MDEIDACTIALTSSPAGCAFLAWAERVGMSPADAADPLMSFFLTGRALDDVTVWRPDQADEMEKLLREGPRLRSFASAVLSQPDAAWWFAPLDRAFQLLSENPGTAAVPESPVVPERPPTEQERYAQHPEWGLYTSTEIGGISSHLVSAQECVGGLGPLIFPYARYARYAVRVSAEARVSEVDGPAAWDRLCRNYPALEQGGLQGNLILPDFAAVARDWDAVHVTLGGLLASAHVAFLGPEGMTALQGWDAEQTVWLNSRFDEVTRLPDLPERIKTPAALR